MLETDGQDWEERQKTSFGTKVEAKKIFTRWELPPVCVQLEKPNLPFLDQISPLPPRHVGFRLKVSLESEL